MKGTPLEAHFARIEGATHSRLIEARILHERISLDVHVSERRVLGTIECDVLVGKEGTQVVVLDVRGVRVHAAGPIEKDGIGWKKDQFALGEERGSIGAPLVVSLGQTPKKNNDVVTIRVEFEKRDGEGDEHGSAMQFLEAEQTSGKNNPFVFTQCQAIHARSLFPCQDTPAAKFTYEAIVRVAPPLRALMAACEVEISDQERSEAESRGLEAFKFEQKVPVPAYLFAFAVGKLESRELSPLTRVWAESDMVEAAATEFADTAKFLEAAVSLAGPYQWGRYDLLLLPPSFPYGGMENPCLTFVTPTLLAGDGSLAHVVAHEIAHSWTGNLVTNVSWDHFWLNEGWTVFLERKILGRIYGEGALQLHAIAGHEDLCEEIRRIGPNHRYTALVPRLEGEADPDEAFSKIPYEKGFSFLYYLQELVGGPSEFEPFMKEYIQHFALSTVDSDQFKAFFEGYFKQNQKISEIEWDRWLYEPGMPPHENHYDGTLSKAACDLALKWHTADPLGIGNKEFQASPSDIEGWSVHQLIVFLDRLIALRAMKPLHESMAKNLGESYGFFSTRNSEIASRFLKLGVCAGNEQCYMGAVKMLKEQGRMKFLRPLYRSLHQGNSRAKELAMSTFLEARSRYHPIAAKMVAVDLGME